MRKTIAILTIVLLVLFMVGCENSINPIKSQIQNDNTGMSLAKKGGVDPIEDVCASITAQNVYYKDSHYLEGPITLGFDVFGYNYQAHLFKGYYCNVYLGGYGYPPYEGDDDAYLAENPSVAGLWFWPYRMYMVNMKWNDAWLANTDCDGDGLLDRHFGFDSYIGSGAWELYKDEGPEGDKYFAKIVAVPEGAELVDGIWYTAKGKEIGPVIWRQFAIIQEKYDGEILYKSPAGPGLGKWK